MGQGGYSWETVYNMPLWLRRFTYNKLLDHYTSKADNTVDNDIEEGIARAKFAALQKQQNSSVYSTKASKK
jgi:hypothetical protein